MGCMLIHCVVDNNKIKKYENSSGDVVWYGGNGDNDGIGSGDLPATSCAIPTPIQITGDIDGKCVACHVIMLAYVVVVCVL